MHDGGHAAVMEAHWGGGASPFGATWQKMTLAKPKNKFDWQRWTGTVKLASDGYYELWVRATDEKGVAQPHTAGNWNPQGYGGNPIHRVAIRIA